MLLKFTLMRSSARCPMWPGHITFHTATVRVVNIGFASNSGTTSTFE